MWRRSGRKPVSRGIRTGSGVGSLPGRGENFVTLEPNYDRREEHSFVVAERVAGKRLDRYLKARFADYSRTCLAGLVADGEVRVDGVPVRPSHRIRAGERIEVSLPLLEKPRLLPDDVPLTILYEDESLVAIDKAAGMVVHPSRGHQRGTLVNALVSRYETLSGVRSELRPGIVHRLDRDTSGVILVARDDEAHVELARQFEAREVRKFYRAVVRGRPEDDRFEVDLPIGPHPANRLKMAVCHEVGSLSQTLFRVVERFDRFSLVEASPRTGRTHQIRVHAQARGHPLAADPLYGGTDRVVPSDLIGARRVPDQEPIIERTCLHAARIEFVHPTRGDSMAIEAPLPDDFERLLAALREISS